MPATPSKAKQPTDHKKSTKSSFGKRMTFPLELPSGNTIEVRRPGVQGLIKLGVLHSLDALTGIVQSDTIPTAEGQPPVDVAKLAQDPAKLESMMDMLDRIALAVVVEPKLHTRPIPVKEDGSPKIPFTEEDVDAARDPELAYVDYVDIEDKTFIMNFALGGSADLVAFRETTEGLVGGVPAVESAENESKQAVQA